MTSHQVEIVNDATRLTLSEAILLYHDARGGGAYASVHDVAIDKHNAPVIGAGAPLSQERLRTWTKLLRAEPPLDFIPDTILARNADALVWWTPAAMRDAYFNLSKDAAEAVTTLKGKIVRKLPYPPLLLAATGQNLFVYALRRNERPQPDTPLYRSPILNVYADAKLCWGSIPKPSFDAPDAIPQYENALFNSWSTHHNAGQDKAVRFKGGCVALWDHLAASNATQFPVGMLRPHQLPPTKIGERPKPQRLADLIAALASS